MEMVESALDKETIDFDGEDVEMADADAYTEEIPIPDSPAAGLGVGSGGGAQAEKGGPAGKKKKKKYGRKKNRGRLDGPPTKIADINRVVVETWNGYFHERVMPTFVLDTCRRLKEKKSYLVWNAIGCLGVSAVSDLVREVEAIQKCGGQMIADGSRFRTGGGILWNILKSREPKAYKEIIVKGRELEKQFMYGKGRPHMSRNEDASSQGSALVDEEIEAQDDAEHLVHLEEAPHNNNKAEPRKPVADRIRVPVSYDDLFEEGEMHEEEPQI